MIDVRPYSKQDKQLWDNFVKNAKNGHFMFLRDYMDYHQDRFHDASMMFYKSGKLIAVLPANIKDQQLSSHQGLSFGGIVSSPKLKNTDMLEVFGALKKHAESLDVSSIIYKAQPHIYHKQPAEEDVYALFRSSAELFRVDSSSTIDLSMPGKYGNGKKTGITRALRESLEPSERDDVAEFMELVAENLKDKYNADVVHTPAEMQLLKDRFPQNIRHFIVSKGGGDMLAGAIVYVDDMVCHAQYINSTELGRKLRAVDLLTDFLIKEVSAGKRYFDFGNSNEENGLVLNKSLNAQKEEFGARTTAQFFYKMSIKP